MALFLCRHAKTKAVAAHLKREQLLHFDFKVEMTGAAENIAVVFVSRANIGSDVGTALRQREPTYFFLSVDTFKGSLHPGLE